MEQVGFVAKIKAALTAPSAGVASWVNGAFGAVKESFAGAWQRNIVAASGPNILATSSVYSCVNVISDDIAKLDIRILSIAKDGSSSENLQSPYTRLVNQPNSFQTTFEFMKQFMASKLVNGNAYVWMLRDNRGVPNEMFVLDPTKVRPLVAPDGSVFYEIGQHDMTGNEAQVIVPARDIMHNKMNTFSHPLIGVSPLYAAGASAMMGARILMNSENFFGNMSRPSGTLNAPGTIKDDDMVKIQQSFQKNYGAEGMGKVAILSQGLEYKPLTINAVDSQLIDQLKWTINDVARVYRVPLFLISEMQGTQYKNTEAMMSAYYTGCLQAQITSIEQTFAKAFDLPNGDIVRFDLDSLFRMETDIRYATYSEALKSGWMSPNEVRKREGLKPVQGGEEPRVQMQYIPLSQDTTQPQSAPAADPAEDATDDNGADSAPEDEPTPDQQREYAENWARIVSDSFQKRLMEPTVNANG